MKLLKLFGLVALAALMAMAFVGAGSAMATGSTAECEDMPDVADGVCTGDLLTHVHKATLSGHKAKLLSSSFTIECDVLFLGDVDTPGQLGNPLEIHGNYTDTNCSNNCTVKEVNGPALMKVLRLGHEKGDVTYKFQFRATCGELIDCEYNGESLLGTATGPLLSTEESEESSLSEQTLNKVGGLFCPSTTKLDIVTIALGPVFIGK